jgi:hypothetical protein
MHKPDDLVIVNMEENIISLPDGDILMFIASAFTPSSVYLARPSL